MGGEGGAQDAHEARKHVLGIDPLRSEHFEKVLGRRRSGHRSRRLKARLHQLLPEQHAELRDIKVSGARRRP
jgi:hypothetical protein